MKVASVAKAVGTATAGSSAVAAPTSLAVINHNQTVTITQMTKQLEDSGLENDKLVQKNQDMDSKHKELQRLDASESYKSRQEIDKLKKEVEKEKAAAQELQNKLKKMEKHNDQLKNCVNIFAAAEMDSPQVYYSYNEHQYHERQKSVEWCIKETQSQGFDQYAQQHQYSQQNHYY